MLVVRRRSLRRAGESMVHYIDLAVQESYDYMLDGKQSIVR